MTAVSDGSRYVLAMYLISQWGRVFTVFTDTEDLPTSPDKTTSDNSSDNSAAIIGGVVAVVIVLIIAVTTSSIVVVALVLKNHRGD